MKTFQMLAKTFRGLEDVLRDELISLGAQNVEIGNRMVSFEGTLETLYKTNLCCRTALRILKPIAKFTADSPDELYDIVRDINWSNFITPKQTLSIDCTVNSRIFTHSKYVLYRVKDGIVDHFNDNYGERPSIRLTGADLQLDVHIDENRVTISLNSSGESLNKRGYRIDATEAPLNEVLAAGIIMKTGWRGDSLFLDPMCGSGTFAIEAALIAARINPGIFRQGFAFEKWSDFDKDLFESLYNDDSDERTPPYQILASDIDPEAIKITNANIKAAKLEEMITVTQKDFFSYHEEPEREPGIIITNPPYGERLQTEEDLELFYTKVGATLKSAFKGYHAWILGYRDEAFTKIGLKPSVKFPINNGGLECSLREYVMFNGSYSAFRTEGGSVHNDNFNRTSKPKVHRMSDKEWEGESHKFTRKSNKTYQRNNDINNRNQDRKRGKFKDNRQNKDNRSHREEHFDRSAKPHKDDFRSKGRKTDFRSTKHPNISIDNEIKFGPARMRSRKSWRNAPVDLDDND